MTKKQFTLLLIAVFTGSILGGAAVQSFNPQTALADNNRTITCNKLVIQDLKGNDSIVLDASKSEAPPIAVIKNRDGDYIFVAPTMMNMYSSKNNVTSIYMASGNQIMEDQTTRFHYTLVDNGKFMMSIRDKNNKMLWLAPTPLPKP